MNAWALQGEARDTIHWISEAIFGPPRKADDRLANKRRAVAVLQRLLPDSLKGWRMIELVDDARDLADILVVARGMKEALLAKPDAFARLAREVAT